MAQPPPRYAKRWKRWVGYYVVLGSALAAVNVIAQSGGAISVGTLVQVAVCLFFVVLGVAIVRGNPKSREQA